MTTLSAFSPNEFSKVKALMRTRVATMAGRKLEEDDWTSCYCGAVGALDRGWSNTDIDVVRVVDGRVLAVEQKMLSAGSKMPSELRGTRKMHPAATRRVTLNTSLSAEDALADVLRQYATVLQSHREFAAEVARDVENVEAVPEEVELRSGWLLWARDLSEFLYFEEPLEVPVATDLVAEWSERRGGRARRATKNLWISSVSHGHKIFSVTDPSSGTKVQPYFSVPTEAEHSYLVQTVERRSGLPDRVWLDREMVTALRGEARKLEIDPDSETWVADLCEAWTAMKESEGATVDDRNRDEEATALEVDAVAVGLLDTGIPGANRQTQLEVMLRDLARQV